MRLSLVSLVMMEHNSQANKQQSWGDMPGDEARYAHIVLDTQPLRSQLGQSMTFSMKCDLRKREITLTYTTTYLGTLLDGISQCLIVSYINERALDAKVGNYPCKVPVGSWREEGKRFDCRHVRASRRQIKT